MQHPPSGFLSNTEETELKMLHKRCKERRMADRIKTLLSLNKGISYEQLSEILLIDDSTLRSYYELYVSQGIQGLLQLHYKGGSSYLNIRTRK